MTTLLEALHTQQENDAESIVQLPIDAITAAPDNPRGDPGDVSELAASMGELGVLQPLIVTARNGGYVAVVGHRRLAAARKAGLQVVPAIVRDYDEPQRRKAMLIENLQREDLSVLEEARAYHGLVELGLSQRDLARDVGRTQSHVSKRLSLLQLPEPVHAQVDSGGITVGDALAMLPLKDDPKRLERIVKRPAWQTLTYALQQELGAKDREDKIAAAAAKAEKKGLKVVKRGMKISKGGGWDALRIDPAKHATEPCHAVMIEPYTYKPVPVCTNRKNHPKLKTENERNRSAGASPSRDSGPAKETLQQLEEAETRRRAFLAQLVQGKSITKAQAVELALRATVRRDLEEWSFVDLAVELLGLAEAVPDSPPDRPDARKLLADYAAKGDVQLARAAMALALAGVEEYALDLGMWRTRWDAEETKPYFGLLTTHGYELSEAERTQLGTAAEAQ